MLFKFVLSSRASRVMKAKTLDLVKRQIYHEFEPQRAFLYVIDEYTMKESEPHYLYPKDWSDRPYVGVDPKTSIIRKVYVKGDEISSWDQENLIFWQWMSDTDPQPFPIYEVSWLLGKETMTITRCGSFHDIVKIPPQDAVVTMIQHRGMGFKE